MAIYDSSSALDNQSGTPASISVPLTVADNTDRVLVVAVWGNNNSMSAPTVTWNSASLTQIESRSQVGGGYVWLFYMIAPDVGTYNVVVTQGATKSEYLSGHVYSFYNINQSTPINVDGSTSNTSASSITLSLTTTASRCYGFALCASQRTINSVDSPFTIYQGGFIGVKSAITESAVATGSNSATFNISGASTNMIIGCYLHSNAVELTVTDGLKLGDLATLAKILSLMIVDTLHLGDLASKIKILSLSIVDTLHLGDFIAELQFIWTRLTKNSTTFTAQNKSSTSFTAQSKNSSNWTEQNKS